MKRFLLKQYLFFILIFLSLAGVAQDGTYSHIIGSLDNKSIIFDPSYLQQLNSKLENLETQTGYSLYIELNHELLSARKAKDLTDDKLEEIKEETRLKRIKSFKNLKAQGKKLGKGVVAHLDFIEYPKTGTTGELATYFMQTISLGPVLSSYAKTTFSAYKEDSQLKWGQSYYDNNKTHLDDLVTFILGVFEQDKTQPQDNFQFGPLVVQIPNTQKVKGSSKTVNGVKLDEYKSSEASFDLPLKSSGLNLLSAKVSAANISYFYDDQTGNYSDVKITYQKENDSIFAGKLVFLNVFVTSITTQISSDGKISGSINVKSFLDRDVQFGYSVVVKSGLAGIYKFTYAGTSDFDGNYDFSGLKNLQLVALKDKQPFASLIGSFSTDGTINGVIQNQNKVEIEAASSTIIIEEFKLDVNYSFKTGLKVNSGSFAAAFSELPGVNGDLVLTGTYDAGGNINASVESTRSKLSIFGMDLQNLKLSTSIDTSFDVKALEGSFFLKHPSFNNTIGIQTFKWSYENGVETLIGSGSVDYQGFYFNLTNLSYADGALICNASLEINTTGRVSNLSVTEFTIDEDGNIDIGGISGSIRQFPFNLTFAAEFDDNRFAGYFKGDMSKIGVEGTVDLGQKVTNTTKYTFCYLKLVVSTPGLVISPVKIRSLGGEIGYNYYIDFAHKDLDNPGIGPGDPKKGSYLAGFTLECTDIAEMVSVTGNPIIQFSADTVDFHMKADVKMPRLDPWFTQNVEVNYQLPSNKLYGYFNTNFRVPRTSGLLIDASNLGMDFYFDKQRWYVGRKNMQAKFFRALDINGDAEFSGDYKNLSAFNANLRAAMDLNFSWSGSQQISVLDYNFVDASAHIRFLFHQQATLKINKEGLAGSFEASLQANGGIVLQVCPSCNYDWTKVNVDVNADIAGKLEFQNTKLHMVGTAMLEAIICSYSGKFKFDVDYMFDPNVDGGSSFNYNTSTSYKQVPTNPSPFVIPSNMPAKGKADSYMTAFATKKDDVTFLAKYPNIRKNLPSIQSTLGSDYSTFETKLKGASQYVLQQLDQNTASTLLAYAKDIKSKPADYASFNKDNKAFDTWLSTANGSSINDYPNIVAKLPVIKEAFTKKGGNGTVIDDGIAKVSAGALAYLDAHIDVFESIYNAFTKSTSPKDATTSWNNAAKDGLMKRMTDLKLDPLVKTVSSFPSKDKFLLEYSSASDDLLKYLNSEIGLTKAWLNGLQFKEDGGVIKILDKVTEIATISGGKFKVAVWKSAFENGGDTICITTNGYVLLSFTSSGKGFDLGFNNRKLDSKEVNEFLIMAREAKKDGFPYTRGSIVEEKVLTSGIIYFVERKGQTFPGGWSSKDQITTIKELRETLAVLQDWKDETKDTLVVRAYEVIAPLRVRDGSIGEQIEISGPNAGKTYPGGGQQYEIIENFKVNNHRNFLKIIPARTIILK